MPRMNNHCKLVFALEHVAHLHDLFEGNQYEKHLLHSLITIECELERQLKKEEDKRNH